MCEKFSGVLSFLIVITHYSLLSSGEHAEKRTVDQFMQRLLNSKSFLFLLCTKNKREGS